MVGVAFDPTEVQGNILRCYKTNLVRHVVVEITNRDLARWFLGLAAQGGGENVPAITRESHWHHKWRPGEKPKLCVNIGFTFAGLRAMGLAGNHLASFPTEFAQGMPARARKLGDVGDSAPDTWTDAFRTPARVHAMFSLHGADSDTIRRATDQIGAAFGVLGWCDGRARTDGSVFFRYKDGIGQPHLAHEDAQDLTQVTRHHSRGWQPEDPLGTILLGHDTRFEDILFQIPSPDALGRNGTFNAFRMLAQDCWGFEDFLTRAADDLERSDAGRILLPPGGEARIVDGHTRHAALREIVAAQMCGRWRDGVPYGVAPEGSRDFKDKSFDRFDYPAGSRCPVGSHIRRANPRGGAIVQRIAQHTRRLVRRGMIYGPEMGDTRDTAERGLLGNFIGASLGAQFEAVMCDWINLGLQHPAITGTNDPLIGANAPETDWFDLVLPGGGSFRLRGLPRFVTTRGGAYLFVPSLPAITHLARG